MRGVKEKEEEEEAKEEGRDGDREAESVTGRAGQTLTG